MEVIEFLENLLILAFFRVTVLTIVFRVIFDLIQDPFFLLLRDEFFKADYRGFRPGELLPRLLPFSERLKGLAQPLELSFILLPFIIPTFIQIADFILILFR